MRTLVINSSNYVQGSGNAYTYTFPSSYNVKEGDQIGVASVSIYNNSFNITSARGNNVFQIKWSNGTTYNLTMSDGYYGSSDLNYALQQFCVTNNLYCTTSSGNYVYFLEVVQNTPLYALQINSYYIPTSANATTLGYILPSGASWSFPATNTCPQLIINTAMGNILGFSAGSYPPTQQATNYQITSTKTPIVSPIDSYILTCSMVNSPLSIPSDTFFTIPLNGSLGTLISINPSQIVFNDIAPNQYQTVTIRLYDQLFNPLVLNDKEMTLTLAILQGVERK